MRTIQAASAVVLSLSLFLSSSRAAESVSGTVVDSATGMPLGGAAVASESSADTTDASGAFQLVFAGAAIAPAGRAAAAVWDQGAGAFRWPSNLHVTSVVIRGPDGKEISLTPAAAEGFQTLPALAPGFYSASLRSRGNIDRFRLVVLAAGSVLASRMDPSPAEASAKASANAAPHTLSFTKSGYAGYSVDVPAGSGPLSIKLKAVAAGSVVRIFDGKTTAGWGQVPANSWEVKDSSMASLGTARGFAYPLTQWSRYRIIFSIRELSGNHNPCVLVFGTDTKLDALGGIQFQLPYGVGWDYRKGHNNSGAAYYTKFPAKGTMDNKQWSRCEILVDPSKGLARAACAQPVTAKAVPILTFKDPAIANAPGYFGLQMHNSGIHDEYKDITVETDPAIDDLITTK